MVVWSASLQLVLSAVVPQALSVPSAPSPSPAPSIQRGPFCSCALAAGPRRTPLPHFPTCCFPRAPSPSGALGRGSGNHRRTHCNSLCPRPTAAFRWGLPDLPGKATWLPTSKACRRHGVRQKEHQLSGRSSQGQLFPPHPEALSSLFASLSLISPSIQWG